MPIPESLKADLMKKIQQDRLIPPPAQALHGVHAEPTVNLGELKPKVTALSPEDLELLTVEANGNYNEVIKFIREMNPYGDQVIAFPKFDFTSNFDRTDIETLADDKGIKVAGWLRRKYAQAAEQSSDMEMSLADKNQCFYWNFRYPDDPKVVDEENPPKGGEMMSLQITKAVRIPFVYRRSKDGTLLLGHIVIGYEGAGSM
jgi:hypothetical protein